MDSQPAVVAERTRTGLRLALYGAVLVGLYYVKWHHFSGADDSFVGLAIGCVAVALAAIDLRVGTTSLVYSTIKRSEDSVAYWTAVLLTAGLGVSLVVLSSGDLLGWW